MCVCVCVCVYVCVCVCVCVCCVCVLCFCVRGVDVFVVMCYNSTCIGKVVYSVRMR